MVAPGKMNIVIGRLIQMGAPKVAPLNLSSSITCVCECLSPILGIQMSGICLVGATGKLA